MGHEVEMFSYGHAGLPVILFPTSMGHFNQYAGSGLIEAAAWFIDQGLVRIYCPDSFDEQSWYNKGVAPHMRVQNYLRYEKMISQELIPAILSETGQSKVMLGGCSFGGYHAANLAFRHPDKVSYLFSMSGMFDIRSQLDGYYDQDVYFNNPVDFIPGLDASVPGNMGIVLGAGELDICRGSNQQLSAILDQKQVSHWLHIVPGAVHDWPVWIEMFPLYLSKINFS